MCQSCDEPKCELVCRALGCNVARHARCFVVDRSKYKLVMGAQAGKNGGLHVNHDCAGHWVCPEHIVAWVYKNRPLPPAKVVREAVELETVRQYMFFYSRSAAKTASNMASGFKMIREFEDKFQLQLRPSVYGLSGHSEIASSWLVMKRAQEVKVQSISSVYSAFAFAYASAAAPNPFNHPEVNRYSTAGHSRRGLEHVLGKTVKSQPDLSLSVVQAVQKFCFDRAAEVNGKWNKLYYLEVGFFVVACTMGFLRPEELPLNYLFGIWSHFFIGERARLCGVVRPYIGFLFGEPEVDATTGLVTTTGGQTKVTRANQRLDCDKRGSDLVIVGKSQGGLDPAKFLVDILALHGVDAYSVVWPRLVGKDLPLFHNADGTKRSSSGGKNALLPRVRGVLVYLKTQRMHPDLQSVDLKAVTNYCWKITGASEAQRRGVPVNLRNGHGRWRLFSKSPCEMVHYYAKASLRQKLSCSDFGAPWMPWD